MPAVIPVMHKADTMLDGKDQGAQRRAHDAVREATSVKNACERAGILDDLEEAVEAEARAVLDALPKGIDDVLLSALRSGLERSIPISLIWEEGDAIALRVTEKSGGTQLDIVLVTPDGREFTK